ncbi:hypothetical protein ACQ86B_28965 (plasmid) [Mycolicibacterium aichiense]|uniref:hypothetical protein n=1 Tax=Mycolicibacterium aichiense TaxID=1799 RepID=UPI003D6712FA
MSAVIDFGDAEFRASAGMVFHVMEWLADQLPTGDPTAAELLNADNNNIARLDVSDDRSRTLINLLADHLPAYAHTLTGSDPQLAQQLQQLGAAARRHRRRQLAIRSGDSRARYRSLPPAPDPEDAHGDVDTQRTEVEHGQAPDYNEGALPYLPAHPGLATMTPAQPVTRRARRRISTRNIRP